MSTTSHIMADLGGGDVEWSDPSRLPADPFVSVLMVTYNHADYIRQALDSVLMQQVKFPYEICVGEDGSSDGTREVCLEYANRCPDRIRLFLRDRANPARDSYTVPFRHNTIATLRACRGKYVALLDGDDYWTDLRKLQKQVDFLGANPDLSGCFHQVRVVPERTDGVLVMPSESASLKERSGLRDVLRCNRVPACSAMLQADGVADFLALDQMLRHVPMADWALMVLAARRGQLGFLREVMAAYRVHGGGIWSQLGRKQMLSREVEFYEHIRAQVPTSAQRFVRQCIAERYLRLAYLAERADAIAEARRHAACATRSGSVSSLRISCEAAVLWGRLTVPGIYAAIRGIKRLLSGTRSGSDR